jgi:diguanylate cyclase (GGDEF)-like protein
MIVLVTAVAVVTAVVYVLLPVVLADIFFQLIAWGSIAIFVHGVRRNGGFTVPWAFIGAGWTSFAIGDLLFTVYDHVSGSPPFPSVADLFYLAGYPFLAAGLASLVRRSRPDGDRIAVIDAAIILVPAAVAAWIYLVQPYAASASTGLERAVSAAYPLGDLLCLAVLVRLFSGTSRTRATAQPAMWLLGAGLVVMLFADNWFVMIQLNGTYASGGLSDSLYLVPYMAVAAAAMSPSMRHIGHPLPKTDPSLGTSRLVMLAIAALVTPTILFVQWLQDKQLAVPLIVAGTVLSFVLVIARMASLVDALESSRAELAFDATHDHLTGLANRSLFARRLQHALDHDGCGSLLFIDLDNFKRVNDRFGHREGDQMLVEVGERLRRIVRSTDLVARLAGDEFGVLMPGATQSTVRTLADQMVQRLAFDVGLGADAVPVTASIGAVSWASGDRSVSAEGLLAEADHAMYRVKATSGNGFVASRA